MSARVYIAAPIFTPEQLDVVNKMKWLLDTNGVKNFSPYHNSQQIFQGRKPMDCHPSERARVLEDNIANLDWCTILLAWVGGMGGFTDPGVVWEMGYAHALARQNGTHPITIAYIHESDQRQSMNLMLAGTVDAAVKGVLSLTQVISWLPDMKIDAIKTVFDPAHVLGDQMDPVV